MKLRNVIIWTFSSILFLLIVSTEVQAQELKEVDASDILEKIEHGEDIFLENVQIIGNLNVSEIELKTIPIKRTQFEIERIYLKDELKVVESKITIKNSVFENDVDFSQQAVPKLI